MYIYIYIYTYMCIYTYMVNLIWLTPSRERVGVAGSSSNVLKALVSGSRAANKYKEMHSALAICVAARSQQVYMYA